MLPPNAASAAPVIAISPSQLAFGEACVSAPTPDQQVTIRNTGDASMSVSSIVVTGAHADDFRVSDAEPRTVAPGGSSAFLVRFVPQSSGQRTARVRVESNGGTAEATLSGRGVTRVLEVSPDRLDFGAVRQGAASDDLRVALASTGNARVTITNVFVGGTHRSDFSVGAVTSRELEPGRDALVPVRFRGRAQGARSATLTIESDACAGRVVVALTGQATAPDLRIVPAPIDLGDLPVGATPATPAPVVIANTGRAPLRLTDISLEGAHSGDFRFSGFPELPRVLGAGEEIEISASFVPSQPGPRRALLRIASDDPDSPILSVEVRGNVSGSALPSPSPTASPEPSPTRSAVALPSLRGPRRVASGGGAGDYIAVAVVIAGVGGVFAMLFALRKRRALEA